MTPNLIIIQLLHSPSNPAEFLRLCWDNLSVKQKKEIFYFLYNSKQYRTFLITLRLEMTTETPTVPWTHLFSILKKYQLLSEAEISLFLNSNTSTEDFTQFRINDTQLSELWNARKQKVLKDYQSKKDELIRALAFAKQQGLKEARLKTIKELSALYPNDNDILNLLSQEKEFQARQTITRISQKKEATFEHPAASKDTDEVIALRAALLRQCLNKLKSQPESAADLVLLLYHMDLFTEALKLIDSITAVDTKLIWYEVMICIEIEQYVRGLSALHKLKSTKLDFIDQSFSIMYFHAIILNGLGHKAEAQQMLKNIIKIRPQFKSAASLLNEWEQDL